MPKEITQFQFLKYLVKNDRSNTAAIILYFLGILKLEINWVERDQYCTIVHYYTQFRFWNPLTLIFIFIMLLIGMIICSFSNNSIDELIDIIKDKNVSYARFHNEEYDEMLK